MKISIVTPSYNQGRFLRETMESVLKQDVPELEYIVLDGGSQDESLEVIKEFAPSLAYWRSAPDNGQAAAIHEGFLVSSGDILAWLNADDVFMPGALRHVLQIFQENPERRFLYGGCELIDVNGRRIKSLREPCYKNEWQIYVRSCVPQSSAFWRRDLYFEVGGVDTSLHYAMDYDLWFKFARQTTPYITGMILSRQRQHSSTKTSNTQAMESEKEKVRRRFFPYLPSPPIRKVRSALWRMHRIFRKSISGCYLTCKNGFGNLIWENNAAVQEDCRAFKDIWRL
jgi:glycosyltransferase involved in cell wall biosynthesis